MFVPEIFRLPHRIKSARRKNSFGKGKKPRSGINIETNFYENLYLEKSRSNQLLLFRSRAFLRQNSIIPMFRHNFRRERSAKKGVFFTIFCKSFLS